MQPDTYNGANDVKTHYQSLGLGWMVALVMVIAMGMINEQYGGGHC